MVGIRSANNRASFDHAIKLESETIVRLHISLLCVVLCLPFAARAGPGDGCVVAARAAGAAAGLPPGLLRAIGLVESGRRDAAGRRTPWPYAVDADGKGSWFANADAAAAYARAVLSGGARSVDVGCFQIDLRDHPDAFASLHEAFDPMRNAIFAAGFLARLHARLGGWAAAIAAYHSATRALGAPYAALVRAAWRGGGTVTADPYVIRIGPAPRGLPVVVTP